jgi:peptidoglycan LD-endopeptidase LytH
MKEEPAGLKWVYPLMAKTAAKLFILTALAAFLLAGCGELDKIISSRTPYESYLKSLTDSGIINTEAGARWKEEGERVFQDTLFVTLPYKEVLYFSPSHIYASGYTFPGRRGENIIVSVNRDSAVTARLFIDLFIINGEEYEHLASSGIDELYIDHTVRKTGMYFIRIQPELLGGGRFYLEMTNSPSLAFPVHGVDSRAIKSFWGDRRDGGAREHKGVDIFASRGTPVLAAENGIISRTGTNNLGGNVVWLTTLNKSLYYAHLDSQAVSPLQVVKKGDTLGFVGNTGNARYTPPHLHFGIYYRGEGAVDPLPYIRDYFAGAAEPKVTENLLGTYGRTTASTSLFYSPDRNKSKIFPANTPVMITGSTGEYYKGKLYNGKTIYVRQNALTFNLTDLTHKQPAAEVHMQPDPASIITGIIDTGEQYKRVGVVENFVLIDHNGRYGWIKN